MSELPTGWSHFSLNDLGGLSGGKTPSKANPAFWSSPDVPWVSPKDMKRNLLEDAEDRISQIAVDEAGMTLYPAGSVLMVTRSGILQHTFPVALAGAELTVNQDIKVLRPIEGIDAKFAFYLLKSYGGKILSACAKDGTTVQSIDSEKLEAFAFPLPPLAEQTRIAAKLDELLAQVDTLKARIDGIPALLKRFRQSVLAAAVSGRLTEEWRARNCCPAWREIKLEDMLAGTKDGICRGPFGSSIKKEFFVPAGYKVYEQKNAIRDSSSIGEYFVDEGKYKELERFSVRPGDFIISCAGTLGRISLLPVGAPAGLINQALIRIRTNKDLVLDEYFLIFFRSPVFQEKLIVSARGGAMQNLASTKEIKALEIYCPTIPEQTEIVRRVEQLFAFADQLEAKVKNAKARIDRLTQSILAKAFRGELVPQDPSDEPACELLARIQAQRAAAPKAKAKRGRKSA